MGRPLKPIQLHDVAVSYYPPGGSAGQMGTNGFWRIHKQESDTTFDITDGVVVVRASLVPVAVGS